MPAGNEMIVIRHRFPTLKSLGVAVEYFPTFQNHSCRLHAIDVVVFSVCLSGHGKHFIDETAFDTRPGCVGITSHGQRHDIVTTRRGMEKFNVYLDVSNHALPLLPPPLRDVLTAMIPPRPILQHRFNRAFQFRISDLTQLRQTLRRIEIEIHERMPGYAEVVRGCLTTFLIDCCRGAQESGLVTLDANEAAFPAWASELRAQLDERFDKSWTLQRIAKEYGVSVGHLCRTFIAYTGKSVMDFLIDRRVGAAMRRLEADECKVERIATELGFNDTSYFYRQFKSRTGDTPAAYRRKHRRV